MIVTNGVGRDTAGSSIETTQLNDTYALSFEGGAWLGVAARPAEGGEKGSRSAPCLRPPGPKSGR